MKNKKMELVALASIPLIMTLGNSMLIPILPLLSRQLGISSFQVSLIITLYGLIAIPMIPIAGYLSDRFGRKKIILPSLILTSIGGGICIVASLMMQGISAYWLILAGRLVQGIGAAGAFPIVLPFIGDLYKDEAEVSKNLAIVETYNTFGKVLSPIIGAFLGTLLWYAPFIAIPILSIISFLLVLFLVRSPKTKINEKNKNKKIGHFIKEIKSILHEKGRWIYAIFTIGGICMFVIFGVLFYLSESLESKYNIHGVFKGFILAIPLSVLCIASYATGKVIGKNKALMKWMGFSGMLILSISMLILLFINGIYWIVGLITISGIGIGLVLPSMDALITEGIEKETRGTITSLYSSMRFIGVALGPVIVSLLINKSNWMLFGLMIALGIIGALLTLFSVKPQSSKSK